MLLHDNNSKKICDCFLPLGIGIIELQDRSSVTSPCTIRLENNCDKCTASSSHVVISRKRCEIETDNISVSCNTSLYYHLFSKRDCEVSKSVIVITITS